MEALFLAILLLYSSGVILAAPCENYDRLLPTAVETRDSSTKTPSTSPLTSELTCNTHAFQQCNLDFYRDDSTLSCKPCLGTTTALGCEGLHSYNNVEDGKGIDTGAQVSGPVEVKQDPIAQDPTTQNLDRTPNMVKNCGSDDVITSRQDNATTLTDEVSCGQMQQLGTGAEVETPENIRKEAPPGQPKEEEKPKERVEAGSPKDDEQRRADEEKKRADGERHDREHRERDIRKKERLGKCITILTLGVSAKYAVDFFDEGFLSDDKLVKSHWPIGLPDVPPSDIDTDEWQTKFIEGIMNEPGEDQRDSNGGGAFTLCGGGGKIRRDTRLSKRVPPWCRRSIPELFPHQDQKTKRQLTRDVATEAPSFESTVSRPRLGKRFFPALGLVLSFAARVGQVAGRVTRAAKRVKKIVDAKGPRIAQAGKSKYSKADMDQALDNIKKSKNWRNCLEGKAPVRG
ncbi:hypothetical protein CAC42_1293 [Sphaceloma murrayae]|uniref:Uncharacterized protein n=1 Tax=Sphaceloma murrayae TaxID=2082308 RepID=A0A2K1R2J2_9PEZI|nr:hypothetical protein CAC42_1293 [Sphaceloma murrayae]